MRRVRLTEGQLHNVIRESVNQILNELDWKTYDNAERKRYHQMKNQDDNDEYHREVMPLASAAAEAAIRQYPHLSSGLHKEQVTHEPLTPEEQEDLDNFREAFNNQLNGRYKYEKGGRGYYLDDED